MKADSDPGDLPNLPITKRWIVFSLRIFFKLLYHQLAWMYDGIAAIVSLGNWQKWIQAVVPFLNGPRVLEVGFGPGHLQVALQQKGIAVTGLDESLQMVRMAQKQLKTRGFHPNLIRGDALSLPFAGESFHQVVMTFPAEYIIKPAAISEIKRVLVNRGIAMIVPFAWITGHRPLERLFSWVNRITGEAPDWDPKVLDTLQATGFDPDWEMLHFSNSKIVLIRLIKV